MYNYKKKLCLKFVSFCIKHRIIRFLGCSCSLLGTDSKQGTCDRVSGQCPCLPNVIGLNCDQCTANHWKIASGVGCELCLCDPIGSKSEQCDTVYNI